jgi:hypothetical protein
MDRKYAIPERVSCGLSNMRFSSLDMTIAKGKLMIQPMASGKMKDLP